MTRREVRRLARDALTLLGFGLIIVAGLGIAELLFTLAE